MDRRAVPLANAASWHFEPNVGQTVEPVRFIAHGNGYGIALSKQGVRIDLGASAGLLAALDGKRDVGSQSARHVVIGIRFVHANSQPRLEPEQRQSSVTNYLLGDDPTRWYWHVANFGAVRYCNIYPGIDWVLYGNRANLEYDLVVAPGADPREIVLAIDGSDQSAIDSDGNLVIRADGRSLQQRKPIVYQSTSTGGRDYVRARYVRSQHEFRLSLGQYDRHRPLVIDPVLAFSTYLGGSGTEHATAVATDSAGNVYVAGDTSSINFPTVNGLQTTNKGENFFVTKFNAAGTSVSYSTYFGGSGSDLAFGLSVDSAGNVYVAGSTTSSDFPVYNAFQSQYGGVGPASQNGFVAKFNSSGDSLVYSTYLGGSNQDSVHGLAVDSAGAAYVVGETSSSDFPVANALQTTLKGRINAFISKLAPDGSSLEYSTYLGGSAADIGNAIALDTAGEAFIGGSTNSLDFPTVNPFQSENHVSVNGNTNSTGFFAKVNGTGDALVYSSYLGGSGFELVYDIAVGGTGNAYVVGQTGSTDFPTRAALQSTNNATTSQGGGTAFVTKVASSGASLIYSTYLGGSGGGNGFVGDAALSVAVDASGNAFVAGRSSSTDFPTVSPVQATNKAAAIGATNAFVTELSYDGTDLLFSTYLGGSGSFGNQAGHTDIPDGDYAASITLDPSDNIYIAGQTSSSNFPTLNAYQEMNKTETAYGTNPTAFVAKFGAEVSQPPPPSSGGTTRGGGAIGWGILSALALIVVRKAKTRNL